MTEKRREILRLMSYGRCNKGIALELGVSHETVKSHVRKILDELDARNRTHAVAIALRRGEIE